MSITMLFSLSPPLEERAWERRQFVWPSGQFDARGSFGRAFKPFDVCL
jgi:hypothetical protein